MLALERQGIPTWVRRLVWGVLRGSSTTILFAGAVTVATIQIRRGIRQGCPSSASLWAPLFDPLVRSLIAVIPPALGLAGCFADDLACAFRDVVEGLRRALPVLRSFLHAAGRALSLAKCILVNYSR